MPTRQDGVENRDKAYSWSMTESLAVYAMQESTVFSYVTSRDATSPLCSIGILIGWFCSLWRGSSSRIVGLSNRNELAKSSELHFTS